MGRKGRRRAPVSILVVEFDSDRLRAQGLDLAPFAQALALIPEAPRVEIVRGTTQAHLLAKLADLHGNEFRLVAVIGHSSEEGIHLASDRSLDTWEALAGYFRQFRPHQMLLVACQAGRSLPVGILFNRISTLRQILASPVKAGRVQGQLMIALIPYLVNVKAPSTGLMRVVQAALAGLVGGQLWQWNRAKWERGQRNRSSGTVEDALADIIDSTLRRLRPPTS